VGHPHVRLEYSRQRFGAFAENHASLWMEKVIKKYIKNHIFICWPPNLTLSRVTLTFEFVTAQSLSPLPHGSLVPVCIKGSSFVADARY